MLSVASSSLTSGGDRFSHFEVAFELQTKIKRKKHPPARSLLNRSGGIESKTQLFFFLSLLTTD